MQETNYERATDKMKILFMCKHAVFCCQNCQQKK